MRRLLELLSTSLETICKHGFKSFLTALGISVGVAAVIAIVALIQGLSGSINGQFKNLGADTLTITSYSSVNDQLEGRLAKLQHSDLELIEKNVSNISQLTPLLAALGQFGGTIDYAGNSTHTNVFGTTGSYQTLHKIYPTIGRFIASADEAGRRRVCVIGEDVRQDLELPENPVGEYINIQNRWFKIVGVMEARGELLGLKQDNYIIIPYSTARNILGLAEEPDIRIQFKVDVPEMIDDIQFQTVKLLRKSHKIQRGEVDDFKVQTSAQLVESFEKITNIVTAVLGGIVLISLLVGGIGIMNIMLVSVTERTREIGILKAIGATRIDILGQFVFEALFLCLLGGILGIVLGYLAALLVSTLIPGFPNPEVPLWSVVLAFGFCGVIGLVFGILPAAKAANLDPIEALRYE